MKRTAEQLRSDALRIWSAGVEAVQSDRLVRETVRVDGHWLLIDEAPIDLHSIGSIAVVGAGKAGAGMAAGLEQALGEDVMRRTNLSGWVNVPDDCARRLSRIRLHGARPPGRNEPTERGIEGSSEILRLVSSLGPADLCICLISGGGSALLPAPVEGVSLEDKLLVTRLLSAAGADIRQLNTVRKRLSQIKGGGLARRCTAGRLVSLIISDVMGDPLDVIASGPTVANPTTPADALAVLERFGGEAAGVPAGVLDYLRRSESATYPEPACEVTNVIIGNNATAVDAAGMEAERLGYSHAMIGAAHAEGPVEDIGRHLAVVAMRMSEQPGPDCLISGGEGTVRLCPEDVRGLGGRNQQLALAAMIELSRLKADGVLLLSAGTDGEDGPTDAAGAYVDRQAIRECEALGLEPADYLQRNDAYRLFERIGTLIKTGPTDTNVCDIRVVLVDRMELAEQRT